VGPCLLKASARVISLETRVSGEVMQTATTDLLIIPIVDLIVYLLQGMTFELGDIIATGTPGAVGDSPLPPRYPREGDVVEVTVSGVGTLRNPVHFEVADE
jgi:acylpyruvate hydrolase